MTDNRRTIKETDGNPRSKLEDLQPHERPGFIIGETEHTRAKQQKLEAEAKNRI
ncbi:hypothetical protein [Paenibacillus gansuensis]|uniref:Uncharacterized protein n=1 Tax=Paenibacillus gansuensis TaxID=306542 RepID=A0ABW5PDD2_9BACL